MVVVLFEACIKLVEPCACKRGVERGRLIEVDELDCHNKAKQTSCRALHCGVTECRIECRSIYGNIVITDSTYYVYLDTGPGICFNQTWIQLTTS